MSSRTEIGELAPDGPPRVIEDTSPGPSPIENAAEALCALFLIAMIVLIGSEAIARNVFSTSLQVTDEIGGYLLVGTTFLSMSVAEAHGAFHRVELIQARLGRSARITSQIVFHLMSLGASIFITWQLMRLAYNSWRSEDVAPTPLQTPLWLPQSAMAIGMTLLCIALIRTVVVMVSCLRGRRQP